MRQAIGWVATLLFATCVSAQVVDPGKHRAAAQRFGTEVARALNERDKASLARLLDFHGLAQRAAQVQGLNGKDEQDYIKGVESVGVERLIQSYFQALDSSQGTVKFMRVTDAVPARSLVRLDLGDRGFNYFEYVLSTSADGRTRAVDWYQVSTGELMSVTIGGVSQLFMASNRGMLERLLGGAKVDEATLAKLHRIGELQRAGKPAEALQLLKQLPDPLGSTRILLAARASMASFAQLPDEYDAALAKMAEKYANDPAASFMLIDYYFKREDTPQVLKALGILEQRVGIDGITSQLRANTYLFADDFTNALKYADDSIRLEPDRVEGHDTRATILVQMKRYTDAVDAYRAMEKQFDLAFTREVFADPIFAPFVASKPFQAWLPK